MKSFRSILSVSFLGLATVLAGCAADATSGEASEEQALVSDPAVAAETTPKADDVGAPRGKFGRHGHGGRNDFLVRAALREDLGLTAAQKTVLEGLVAKRPDEGTPPEKGDRPKGDDEALGKTLAAAIRGGSVASLARPEPTAEQKAEHEARRQAHVAAEAKTLATLHSTLTGDQRKALVAALESHEGKRPEGNRPQADDPKGGRAHGPRGEGGKRSPFGPMLADLNLTDAQKDSLKTAMEAHRSAKPSDEERKVGFEKMRAEHKQKLESFASETFDATAFVTPKERPQVDRGERVDPMVALVKVLQPEQREKLAQRIEQGPRHGHGPRQERETRN